MILYHNTSNEKAINIAKRGIIAGLEVAKYGKGSEAEGSGVWCSTERGYGYGGATITFKIDIDDDALWKANDTEYMIFRNIEPNEIVDIDLQVSEVTSTGPHNTMESDIPQAINKHGKDKVLQVFKKYENKFIKPYNYDLFLNLVETGNKYCIGNIYDKVIERKIMEQKEYINKDNFTWNDNMKADKPLYINAKKEQILNGSSFYRDKYISDTWAFLAPDNFGADTVDEIEVDLDTQLSQAGKEFDKICDDVRNYFVWACQETNQLDLINNTTNWRLRDFISESWYQSEKYDSTTNHRQFAMWRNVVMKGKQGLTDDMLCVTEHMSKFDKLN